MNYVSTVYRDRSHLKPADVHLFFREHINYNLKFKDYRNKMWKQRLSGMWLETEM